MHPRIEPVFLLKLWFFLCLRLCGRRLSAQISRALIPGVPIFPALKAYFGKVFVLHSLNVSIDTDSGN